MDAYGWLLTELMVSRGAPGSLLDRAVTLVGEAVSQLIQALRDHGYRRIEFLTAAAPSPGPADR